MSNNIIKSVDVSPPKRPASEPPNGSIDAIMKAMNKVMLEETTLMLSFAKMMKTFNQNLLNYTKMSAEVSNKAALYTKWEDRISQGLGTSMAGTGLSMYWYPNPSSKLGTILSNYANQLLIGSQTFGNLIQMSLAVNRGKLTSNLMKIQAGTEKCKFIIDFLKGSFENCSNTLRTMSNVIKDALEKDYDSKSKGLYFNKK